MTKTGFRVEEELDEQGRWTRMEVAPDTLESAADVLKRSREEDDEDEDVYVTGTYSQRTASIYRILRDREQPYTMVDNRILKNKEMSFEARGLLVTMLQFPNSWTFHKNHILTLTRNSKKIFERAMRELEELGYASKTRMNDKYGKFYWDYQIADYPKWKPERSE